jgi:hypothetical protein
LSAEALCAKAEAYTGQILAPMLGRRENKRKKGVQAAA